jgi:alkanesulfonate monooxygenase SsuD/methylene tetrahydromethanopterin reductase-like flavin-dependent oxidoreductase (luciferase family)
MQAGAGAAAVRIGISVVPATTELDRIRAVVRMADEVGLDVVGIQDHPYQARFLDTWSLIPALLAQTGACRCSPMSPTCRCGRPR